MVRARSRSVPSSASREVCSQSRSSAAKSSAPGSFARRVRALANWRMLASARWSGRVPAVLLVLLGERERGLGDLRAAGGELGDRLLREPGDHPALGRGPVGPLEPEPPGQPGLQRERRQRRPGALLPVQAAGVDRPPLAVADGLDLVQPQHVDVQLRVAVAAGVLREDRHRDLLGVLEPAGLHAVDPPPVMPGPHIRGLPCMCRTYSRTDFSISAQIPAARASHCRGRLQVAGLPGLDRRGQRAGVRQGDGLVHR